MGGLQSVFYIFFIVERLTAILAMPCVWTARPFTRWARPVCFPSSFRVTLHSTMYLFLHDEVLDQLDLVITLHSTMYLFLQSFQKYPPRFPLLYIPQCIYFYFHNFIKFTAVFQALHSTMYLFLRHAQNHQICL